ncbi:MAG: adenosylcobinamide-GDP ribazoletransferase [Lysinibacillus sp.]
MKTMWIGICLAFQFFSVLPIKREFNMTRATMTAMYSALPIVGLVFGTVLAGIYEGLSWLGVSPFFAAVILVVSHIICTGGLHLDGYVDVSDAFFSYGDKEKRLQILEDPRTGAFGVISVVVLLMLQTAATYELLVQNYKYTALLFIVVPIILRCGIMLYFTTMRCAKTSGIAYYFATNMKLNVIKVTAILVMLAVVGTGMMLQQYALVAIVFMQVLLVFWHRRFSYKHFGGMNGDLAGAIYEGSQAILWLTVLLFI